MFHSYWANSPISFYLKRGKALANLLRRFSFCFYNVRMTSRLVTYWIWNAKNCEELLARFTILVIEMKDSLTPSLKFKNWVEVCVLQVVLRWSWILISARWEVAERKFKNEKLGIEEKVKKNWQNEQVICSDLMNIMLVRRVFILGWSRVLANLDESQLIYLVSRSRVAELVLQIKNCG